MKMINLVAVCKNKLIKQYTMDATLLPIVDDLKEMVNLGTRSECYYVQM